MEFFFRATRSDCSCRSKKMLRQLLPWVWRNFFASFPLTAPTSWDRNMKFALYVRSPIPKYRKFKGFLFWAWKLCIFRQYWHLLHFSFSSPCSSFTCLLWWCRSRNSWLMYVVLYPKSFYTRFKFLHLYQAVCNVYKAIILWSYIFTGLINKKLSSNFFWYFFFIRERTTAV